MRIIDVMQASPVAVHPEDTLHDALARMIEQRISAVPVVDAEGRIVGALSETDLLKIFYEPDATTVGSIMSSDPVVVSLDASLLDVVDRLMSSDFRRVLVQQGGRLVGVITRRHLIPAILEALQQRESARRGATVH